MRTITTGRLLVPAFYLAGTLASSAGTFYVDRTNATPVAPYTNWATAATNIQDAIDVAGPGDTVLVNDGTYDTGGRALVSVMTNRVVISQGVTVQSVNGPNVTIIQGYQVPVTNNGVGAVRCVWMTNGAVLSGFTVTGGATLVPTNGPDNISIVAGGGVWSSGTNTTITNCVISGNTSGGAGAGAYQGNFIDCSFYNNNSQFGYGGGANTSGTISNCIFSRNRASRGGGAAGGYLYNCTISENTAGGFGGGVYSSVLSNCAITDNSVYNGPSSAPWGGGASDCTLINCTVLRNTAIGSGGGALNCTLTGCTVSYNASTVNSGGGIYGGWASNCTINGNSCYFEGGGAWGASLTNCSLSVNYSTEYSGGGASRSDLTDCYIVYNTADFQGGGTVSSSLTNCLVFGNHAQYDGGGAYFGTLRNCSVWGNSANRNSGGVHGTANYNCIIQGNTASDFPNYFSDANTVLLSCCTSPMPAYGADNITNDPSCFAPGLGNMRLQSDSPCINAGKNYSPHFDSDLDGNPRVIGGTVDIGAYEFQSPTSIISYAWLQQNGLPTDGSADFSDTDGDKMNNWQEWRAGTVPTNAASLLLLAKPVKSGSDIVVTWQSVTNRTYYLQRATNLNDQVSFLPLETNIVGQAGTTSYTNLNAAGAGKLFYRVGVQ